MAEPFDQNLLTMITKSALTPPGDPAAMGGAPPMDPNAAAMAGTPGGMASMPGMPPAQLPPMDPAAAGGGMGMPMDPSMMGGMPMDPSMMGGAGMPMGAGDPNMAAAMGGGQPGAGGPGAGGKMKPEQMMQVISLRLFNIEQQLATVLREKGKSLDPGAMIQPSEATIAGAPKGPEDPAMQGAGEQQKVAAVVHQLHEVRATLQNQAPDGYDVWLVRRSDDPVKSADARMQSIYDRYFEPSGQETLTDDLETEGAQLSELQFGAKAAADFLANHPVQPVPDNGQLEEEFAGTLLGHSVTAPHIPANTSPRQDSSNLLGALGIRL